MTNAELMNQEGELGVLATGAKADLLVVDGNPLDDIGLLLNQGQHLPIIMRDGRIYKDELEAVD